MSLCVCVYVSWVCLCAYRAKAARLMQAGHAWSWCWQAAQPDPLLAFAAPVMRHMNDDHTDALKVTSRVKLSVNNGENS
jgi:hypothetical protein